MPARPPSPENIQTRGATRFSQRLRLAAFGGRKARLAPEATASMRKISIYYAKSNGCRTFLIKRADEPNFAVFVRSAPPVTSLISANYLPVMLLLRSCYAPVIFALAVCEDLLGIHCKSNILRSKAWAKRAHLPLFSPCSVVSLAGIEGSTRKEHNLPWRRDASLGLTEQEWRDVGDAGGLVHRKGRGAADGERG
jgi:hypothetical protein